MNHELAKKLKDAGFSQFEGWLHHLSICQHSQSKIEGHMVTEECDVVKIPTLSELIKACEQRFYSIWKRDNGEWRAASKKEGSEFFVGSTPEEAVANLWLSLKIK